MKRILFFLSSALLVFPASTRTVWSLTTKSSSNGQEQIDWIIDQQDLHTTGLVDSYEDGDSDEAWIYDQALAIMALTTAGELDRARMILDKMKDLQLSNGAWYEAYHAADCSPAAVGLITGPIAWMAMGINFYEYRTADSSYAAMARRALDWMDTMRSTNPMDERYGSLRFSVSVPDVISTEHNLDAYSAYYWRGILDSDNSYIDKANLVLDYLRTEMWAPSPQSNGPYHDVNIFWEGWGSFAFSTDPQSWGVLSLGPVGPDAEDFAAALDWLWSAPYGNTRTVQDYNPGVLDVEGVKSGTGEPTDYIWIEATDGVASAYYDVGDNVRGEHFHSQMARTVGGNGGLVHSFCEVNPDSIRWPQNFRHNHLASVAWHYFNRATPRINPFRPAAGSGGGTDVDYNDDGYVDLDDLAEFEACASGPAIPQNDPSCADKRLDADDDVDQTDFGLFQVCYSGDQPASPECRGQGGGLPVSGTFALDGRPGLLHAFASSRVVPEKRGRPVRTHRARWPRP